MSAPGVHRGDMYDDDPTIAAFALDLQDAAAASPAPAVGASLAAVLDGRAPAAVPPEVVAPAGARRTPRSARLRWAVASAAFGIGAGSLGVAGALPGPVQRQVSRMAEVVGVDLPDGGSDRGPSLPTVPPSTVVVPPRPTVLPADDRPVPSTVPDDPSNRGNREGRGNGHADERERGRSQDPDVDADDVGEDLDDRSGPSVDEDQDGEDHGGPGGGNDDDGEDEDDDVVEKLDARRNPSTVTDVHPS